MLKKSRTKSKATGRTARSPAKRRGAVKPYVWPIPSQEIRAMQIAIYRAVSAGEKLDENMLVKIAQALAFLDNEMFRQEQARRRKTPARAMETWTAASIVCYLVENKFAANDWEAVNSLDPVPTVKRGDAILRACRKLRAQSHGAVRVCSPELEQAAAARLLEYRRRTGKK